MPRYSLDITDEAKGDLRYYRAYEQKIIVDEITSQLSDQPDVETGSRRLLRDNLIARWELKIGKYRAFYEIDLQEKIVSIVSIGHKEHNVLYIRGKVMKL
jgi:mRNA-degrading endonuclease RelE of RelBE toxin-antitoxin system